MFADALLDCRLTASGSLETGANGPSLLCRFDSLIGDIWASLRTLSSTRLSFGFRALLLTQFLNARMRAGWRIWTDEISSDLAAAAIVLAIASTEEIEPRLSGRQLRQLIREHVQRASLATRFMNSLDCQGQPLPPVIRLR